MTDIVERLTGLLAEWENHAGPFKDAEIERLRETLWFYARPLNYDASPSIMVVTDGGEIARRALEPKP